MKTGKKMKEVKGQIKAAGMRGSDDRKLRNAQMSKYTEAVEEIPEDAGYYSLIIVKEKN